MTAAFLQTKKAPTRSDRPTAPYWTQREGVSRPSEAPSLFPAALEVAAGALLLDDEAAWPVAALWNWAKVLALGGLMTMTMPSLCR